jgi:hypothetical protein
LESVSAREWGREQAAASPRWSQEKWKRVGLILGVEFIDDERPGRHCKPDQRPPDVDHAAAAA